MGGSPYASRSQYGPNANTASVFDHMDERLSALEKQFTKIGPYLTQIAEVYAAMEIEDKDKP